MWTRIVVVAVMLLALGLVLYACQSGLYNDVLDPFTPPR